MPSPFSQHQQQLQQQQLQQQQQHNHHHSQKSLPPVPQMAWTSVAKTAASTTTCSKSASPPSTTTTLTSGCGSWSSTAKSAPRKIRNPKLKLKIAPLRQLSLCQQRMEELSSPSAFPPSILDSPCVDQNNVHLGPICESPLPDACASIQQQQQQQQQQQHPHRSPNQSSGRNRIAALQMRAGTPPKSAPPSVASTPVYFPSSSSLWHHHHNNHVTTATPNIETAVASRVLPNVFLGSEKDAADLDYLKASNITHVLNVSTHIPCFHENLATSSTTTTTTTTTTTSRDHSNGDMTAKIDSLLNEKINEKEELSSTSSSSSPSASSSSPSSSTPGWRLKYKRLAASDNASQNLAQYFLEAFQFIEEALRQKSAVLIHCQAGISRSSTILIAFIMFRSRLSMLQAYKFVKSKRTIISPNLNFMGQLLEFEQKLQRGEILRDNAAEAEGSGVDGLLGDELAAFAAAANAPSEASMSSESEDGDERFDSV